MILLHTLSIVTRTQNHNHKGHLLHSNLLLRWTFNVFQVYIIIIGLLHFKIIFIYLIPSLLVHLLSETSHYISSPFKPTFSNTSLNNRWTFSQSPVPEMTISGIVFLTDIIQKRGEKKCLKQGITCRYNDLIIFMYKQYI